MAAPENVPYAERREVLAYRVEEHGRWLGELDTWRRQVDTERATTDEIIKSMRNDIRQLRVAFDNLRRVLVGLLVSIALSSLVFSFSILAATGKL